tara:strand:- start:21 stop:446 length:426 start_codon:yes stop_codon:yes gene_type:complete
MKYYQLKPLKKFNLPKGNVLKFIDKKNKNYKKFGEVYFSFIKHKSIKAWKMHKKMTLNIAVPIGNIRFILIQEKKNKILNIDEIKIGQNNYKLLTINPKTWYGFQGISKNQSLIVNLTNMLHDENEMVRKNINFFDFNWRT